MYLDESGNGGLRDPTKPSGRRADLDTLPFSRTDWVTVLPKQRRVASERLVVFAPHPDDETVGAGGLIADACASGCSVRIVVVSDGAASHVGVSGLATIRRHEAVAAARRLGVHDPVEFWDFPDGALERHIPELRRHMGKAMDGTDVVLGPVPHDGHSDHDATSDALQGAVEALGSRSPPAHWMYAIWSWQQPGRPDVPSRTAYQWPVSPEGRRRRQWALAEYRSQIDELAGRTIIPKVMIEAVNANHEVFWC